MFHIGPVIGFNHGMVLCYLNARSIPGTKLLLNPLKSVRVDFNPEKLYSFATQESEPYMRQHY